MTHPDATTVEKAVAPYDIDEARARVTRVFTYLQELHRVKTPPVVNLSNHGWYLVLESLPHHPTIHRGQLFGNLGLLREGSQAAEDGCILRAGRPKETECPQPSVVIQNWLKPGWNQVSVEPAVYSKRKLKTASDEDVSEKFEDSEERIQALEDWLHPRKAWEVEEGLLLEAAAVFSDLFQLWGALQRESEKYQLFLGDGILVADSPAGKVRHPLLLQRVQLDFNPLVPEFSIRETADNPEIYTSLLRYLGVESKGLLHVKELVAREHFHPLDKHDTSEFLKDLVHRFWRDGEYFENASLIGNAEEPYIYRQPLLYLGNRNHGFYEATERYIDAVPGFTEFPESLLRIVGIETRQESVGEDKESPTVDVLLTKDANPEQERVIHRLEETGAVLVQGPPGTGKSHTIANLIGHLLAQRKSILVTSHASKALRVVREKVVEPLQSLCVSLLDSDGESSKQLEESITGIVNYFSTTSPRKLEKEIQRLSEKRAAMKERHEELRQQLLAAVTDEYREIEIAGGRASPSTVARKLNEFRRRHDWIPGPLIEGVDLPLTPEQVQELYALNQKISEEDEGTLQSVLPEPEKLPTPKDFASLCDELAPLEKENRKIGLEYWPDENQTPEQLSELLETVSEAAKVFEGEQDWILECLEAGRKGQQGKKSWLGLARLIEKCSTTIPAKEDLILEHGPKVKSSKPARELNKTCLEIIKHLRSAKNLAELSLESKPEWQELVQASEVDDGPPTRVVHFEAILNYLEVRSLREDLMRRWDRQMETLEAPTSSELDKKPEKTAKQYTATILRALHWYEESWSRCERAFHEARFDWSRLLENTPTKQGPYAEILGIRDLLAHQLKPILESRQRYLDYRRLAQTRDSWLEYLNGFPRSEASYPLIKLLIHGIKKRNFDSYSQAWKKLDELLELRPDFERWQGLITGLKVAAPAWARKLRLRRPPHNKGEVPGDVMKAWRYRHWKQILTRQHQVDLDVLQSEINAVKDQLQGVTATYVEKQAWAAQFERTGLKQQQALNGWLALHKKMGRGTGKQVARLKEEAKKTLVKCRQAVPVWIMPLSRVVESFDIGTTRFDVIILDEASQSDVLSLVALGLGREAVVVGDHEQVSPYAVGHHTEKVQGLIDEILTDIPNKQLYDGKTSVYDLARQSFGGTIRLLEHFRCVPDIIQFSNQLCYGGEIRPLREASAGKVRPHLIAHRVKRGTVVNKVNDKEATEIASLVSAICRFPEYANCTIGVISMVGTEQALHIDSILRRRLSVAEYERRRLLCGNAAQFQGDERDVIFLSMVHAPQGRPLSLRQSEEARKVFNVAASRARDQLWVVHSLDPKRDLKYGDLRLKLISHAEDPSLLRHKDLESEQRFTSEFEKRIFQELTDAGFRTFLRHPLGECTIDIVVEEMVAEERGGRRVAILCEGDRSELSEESGLAEDTAEVMERYSILERLGWKFIRLRASEFFMAPETMLKKLFRRLKRAGIRRLRNQASDAESEERERKSSDTLKENVLRRAEMIRKGWTNAPGARARRGPRG